MAIKESYSRKIFAICNAVFMLALCFVFAYPLWYVFIQSLSSNSFVDAAWLPSSFSLENYSNVLGLDTVGRAAFISVLRTVTGTAFTVFSCMLLGYLFTKKEMPFRKFLYRMLIATMYLSAGIVPTYLVMRSYHLLNNFWVYILPGIVSAYYIILIKTYIEQLPAAVEESAMLDGAGTLTIFMRIILPMSMPIVATIAIFTAVGQWNSWFDNHLYTFTNKNLLTMQYLLYRYLSDAERIIREMKELGITSNSSTLITPRNIRMTITMVTVIPVLFVYPFLQRYFVKGIAIGAVKG
jgi:ABC-type glycerol-3-phosphate transport system permease component